MSDFFVHPLAVVEDAVQMEPGVRIYHFSHVRTGVRIGAGTIVGGHCYIDTDVVIGPNCKVQSGARLYHGLIVGSGVFIGPGVQFANDLIPRAINPDGTLKSGNDWSVSSTFVDDGASIGMGACILAGVRIGKWAMVGMGAVVTRDVPEYGLVVGNPARLKWFVCPCGHRLRYVDETQNVVMKCGEDACPVGEIQIPLDVFEKATIGV